MSGSSSRGLLSLAQVANPHVDPRSIRNRHPNEDGNCHRASDERDNAVNARSQKGLRQINIYLVGGMELLLVCGRQIRRNCHDLFSMT